MLKCLKNTDLKLMPAADLTNQSAFGIIWGWESCVKIFPFLDMIDKMPRPSTGHFFYLKENIMAGKCKGKGKKGYGKKGK